MNNVLLQKIAFLKNLYLLLLFCFCFVSSGCRDKDEKIVPINFWNEKADRISKHEEINFKFRSGILTVSDKKKISELLMSTDIKLPIYARIQAYKIRSSHSMKLTHERISSLRKYLLSKGVKSENIQVNLFNSSELGEQKKNESETVILILDQYKIKIPRCPGFDAITTDASQQGEKALGCATMANISRMIVDPKDVYEGGPTATGDGTYETAAIERYRTDKIRPLQVETTSNLTSSQNSSNSSGGSGSSSSSSGGAGGGLGLGY